MDCHKDVLRTSICRLFGTATIVAGAYLMLAATPAAAANPHASFGIGQPKMIDELPPGQLRDKISSLPQHARARALRNLQGFSFPGNDVASIRADPQGGIFYVDPPADSTTGDAGSGDFVPEYSELPQAEVFNLHSKVGASRTVYLDMDGHVVTGTVWNSSGQSGISTLYMRPFSQDSDYTTYTDVELDIIAEVWKRVAEDYAPYDIDVTTAEPASFGPETGHILVSPRVDQDGNGIHPDGYGGVAYVGVWGGGSFAYYQPALVFPENLGNSAHNIAEAASHELGHNLGLSHDGTSTLGYYSGHGSGATDWAPIMGVGYYANVTQWSQGEYPDANNQQDDLHIIGAKLTYRSDDHEDVNFADATPLIRSGATTIDVTTPVADPGNLIPYNKGIIEDRYDRDLFYLDVSGGVIDLTITPAWLESFSYNSRRGMNIDILATLYDASGNTLDWHNPADETDAAIYADVASGRYYLAIEGTGFGSPPASGYSDYGSLGQYFISGTVPADFTYSMPSAPDDVTAQLFGDASITLSWTDPSSTVESNEANYRVYREKDGGSAESIATLPSDSSSYNDNNLPSGSYVYYLEAVNGAGVATSNVTQSIVIDVPSTAFATSEATSMGLVSSGSYVDTTTQTGFESLSELHQGGKPSKRVSRLEHVWTITGVQPAALVTLNLVAEAPANSENDDFNLSYSLDLGNTYTSIGVVANGPGPYNLSANLPPDTTGTVLVKVVDSDATTGNSLADVFNMHYLAVASNGSPEEQPPTVTIIEPAEGDSYAAGDPVVLSAVADDFEDIDISASITWSCDIDENLGTGPTSSVASAAPGEHTITASVTDSAGNEASDSVTITVVDPDAAVSVTGLSDHSIAVRNKWNAVVAIVVQDTTGAAVEGVTVNGIWSNGTTGAGTCVTDNYGRCEIIKNNLKTTVPSVTFQVTGLTHDMFVDSGQGDRSLSLLSP